jgi:hypothetical protein
LQRRHPPGRRGAGEPACVPSRCCP